MAKKKDHATVTLESGGKSVTMDADRFGDAAKRIGKAIQTAAVIKGVKITKDGGEIQVEGCNLTGDQYKKMSRYVAEEESVMVAIYPLQGELFDTENDEDSGE